MKVQDIIKRKALMIPVIIVLSLIIIYTVLSLLVFDADPLLSLLACGTETYFMIAEGIANRYLQWTGSSVALVDHLVMLDGTGYDTVRNGVLMRKWLFLLLIVTWVIPTGLRKKLLYTGLIILLNFILSPITIAIQAHLSAGGFDLYSNTRMSRTPANLMNMTLLFMWLRDNRDFLWKFLSRIRLDADFIKRKSSSIIVVVYVYLILGYFILGCFEFFPWVDFLFKTSQMILSWFQIESVVEPYILIGDNGSLLMVKSCLGFNTMLLFASLVFLTGENSWTSWIYILIGLVILNIANIMRLVLLFAHIQKHGTYVGWIDYHDLYDYIIYGIVFILWVIWFEKLSEIRIILKRKTAAEDTARP
jgi:exosortase/archaeosortase family protein